VTKRKVVTGKNQFNRYFKILRGKVGEERLRLGFAAAHSLRTTALVYVIFIIDLF
jgi:hypothetical protein